MAKDIITLRNAASDLNLFRETFCHIAEAVGTQSFGLEALVDIAVDNGLMASKGRKGEEARIRSYNRNFSLDSMPMQFKAYAEMYRLLGWLRSDSNDKRTIYRITYLGDLLCQTDNPVPFMEQCFLGISLPNGVVERECLNRSQLLWCYLNALYESTLPLSRDQFLYICHAISNDGDRAEFLRRLKIIASPDTTPHDIKNHMETLAKNSDIQINTLSNSTRYTIAALKNFGWTYESGHKFSITAYGRSLVEKYRRGFTLSYTDVPNIDMTIIRDISIVGLVQMLDRGSFSTVNIKNKLGYEKAVENLVNSAIIPDAHTEIYFSPYQVLDPDRLKIIFAGIENGNKTEYQSKRNEFFGKESTPILQSVLAVHPIDMRHSSKGLLAESIFELRGKTPDIIADVLCHKFTNTKQDVFYGLVSEAFRSMGFNCLTGRQGQNGLRCDAIIEAGDKSIPIEIKSPTEERVISVKAIRQALENRVMLAARPPYNTPKGISSLAVGYEYPPGRSEVHELIAAIFRLYGIRIAVLSFRELAKMAAGSLLGGFSPHFDDMIELIGEVKSENLSCN